MDSYNENEACYCAALGRLAPCSYCTNPDNNPELKDVPICECGADTHGWTHSDWCIKFTKG